MGDDELKVFPRGQIGLGTGRLVTCTGGNYRIGNAGQLQHVLAQDQPAGVVFGGLSLSGQLTMVVPEDGAERDLVSDLKKGKILPFKFRDADGWEEITGALTEVTKEIAQENAVTYTASFVGRHTD